MNEINKRNLSKQKKFRLSEITEIENYFHQEINQTKLCTKKLIKYVTTFDYIEKILVVSSTTTGGVSIMSLTSIVGAQVGIASESFTLTFSLTTEIIKNLLSITKNKRKKHNKILMVAKSKLNSIETPVSQALIDMEISHENLMRLLERKKYERMKENVRNVSKKQENMRPNRVNSKKIASL